MSSAPFVSVIIPCYNEQSTIRLLLDAIYRQTYPRERVELVIADGMSTDRTRSEIAAFVLAHPDLQVKVVDNPKRTIPAGLNCAVGSAAGQIFVRIDAHSVPRPDYIERSVAALEDGRGENVGGVWEIRPGGRGWMAASIAMAAAHPLGVGDARYRYTEQAQLVDTVPFGAFRRELLARLCQQGGDCLKPYDESLPTNEDYEFNVRVRQSGGRVWLDPRICSVYFARGTLPKLAQQYWRYGFWKLRMLRRYPETIRWRQALPPLFVLSLLGLGLLALFLPLARWLLLLELALYTMVLLLSGAQLAVRHKNPGLFIGVPLAIAAMHVSWGSAFLWSLAGLAFWNRRAAG